VAKLLPQPRTSCQISLTIGLADDYRCKACELNFVERYGEIGKDFIHVHHTKPISAIGKSYKIKPLNDLVPVCPNCHAMLHRKPGNVPYTIAELRRMIVSTND
jgi:5-methylcytosine-specific restriction enzyme A